jgi:hypothetical protein
VLHPFPLVCYMTVELKLNTSWSVSPPFIEIPLSDIKTYGVSSILKCQVAVHVTCLSNDVATQRTIKHMPLRCVIITTTVSSFFV